MGDVSAFEPPDPGPRPAIDAPEAVQQAWIRKARRRFEWEQANRDRLKRQAAKARAKARGEQPHPNWHNRRAGCAVWVLLSVDEYGNTPWRRATVNAPKVEHRSPWERQARRCGAKTVAYDGTDRRAVGELHGACRHHLPQAMIDDPSRSWLWDATGQPVDPASLDGELVLLALQ